MPRTPPARIVHAIEKLRFGLQGARRKLVPPGLGCLDFISDLWGFQVVYTLTELRVWDCLAGGPRSAADLTKDVTVSAENLYRLLRASTNLGLVKELPSRTFALLPMGRALLENETESFRDYLIFMGRHGWRFWGHLLDASKSGKSAIELETGKKPFEFLTGDSGVSLDFNRAMTAVSNATIEGILGGYNFSGARKIVDIGGGHGRLLGGLLKSVPGAKGVLFDLPSVVADSDRVLQSLGIRDRCEVVGGDFFISVPEGGDFYIMKAVIHDWPDTDAVRILSTVRKAIPNNGRLLLVEVVVPAPGEKHLGKILDIEMMVHSGGMERTREEYSNLLEKSGFRLSRVVALASPASVVEAKPRD